MKTCTACHRLYPDEGGFCPIDGQKLTPVAEAELPIDPDDKRVGSIVCSGKYQIWRIVADGGMGRVYQALDLVTPRTVALKILHQDVATDDVACERFRREFQFSATLPHDHIVEVFAFERTEDQSYALVMEYLEGEELRMFLKREKLMPPARVIRMLSQLGIGLAAPHERKIVHRDLKPDNIFLCHTRDGDVVKILDFGSVRDNSEGAKKLTVMGTTIGSPYYMAPEQAQGLPALDHRADVWSCAAIAYECLTGRVPFEGATGPAILLSILTKEPDPPSAVGKNIPDALDVVMEEALTKNFEIRIKSVGELADRIGRAYGLQGTHRDWASVPQDELAARIRSTTHAPGRAFGPTGSASAAAPKVQPTVPQAPAPAAMVDDPFRAGSAGGPSAVGSTFSEDMIMGVPKRTPRWIVPAIAGTFVLVGVIVAFLMMR